MQVEGELELEVEKARESFALMKRGVLKRLSIGYNTVKDLVQNGVRHLQELKLYEVSIVTFPMNELATVSSVKSEDVIADQVRLFRETLRAAEKPHTITPRNLTGSVLCEHSRVMGITDNANSHILQL